jgi:hypothetical protein
MMMFLMNMRMGTPGVDAVLAGEFPGTPQENLLISLRAENARLRALSVELLMKNEQLRASLAVRENDRDTASWKNEY